jgi:hypothetical protein
MYSVLEVSPSIRLSEYLKYTLLIETIKSNKNSALVSSVVQHRNYTRAASSTGDAVIKCPAFMCRLQDVSKRDCAQILFDPDFATKGKGVASDHYIEDLKLLMDLMRYRIDDILRNGYSTCCTTSSCDRIFFRETNNIAHTDHVDHYGGQSIVLCSCGASYCSECTHASHVGLSCAEFKRFKKDFDEGLFFAEAMR